MNDTKHLWRIFLLVIFALMAFMIGRLLFVPKTFGQFGHYRAANVLEQRAFPVKYQGLESCEPCHSDEFALWKGAGHKTIICEDCHAPYISHIKNDEKFADMEINRSADFCLRCHEMLPARPGKFPQINAMEHLAKYNIALQDTVCLACHGPHNPTPKNSNKDIASAETNKEHNSP